MNLLESLGKALRPDLTPEQKLANLKHDLENIDLDSFFGASCSDGFELEAWSEDTTYFLEVSKDYLNREYYDKDTSLSVIEDQFWMQDKEWIRSFMIKNIQEVKVF